MPRMAPDKKNHQESQEDRRGFFKRGLARLFEPVAGYIERHVDLSAARLFLRPPGAIPERRFLEICFRCGNCVEACPVHAIKPLTVLDESLKKTPTINPNVAACVVCKTIECTRVCPSGALELLRDPKDIRMGLARVNYELCLRGKGEDCTVCVDKCPIGREAIRVYDDGLIEVFENGCVGCGVCQVHCPTQPRAVTIQVF